MPCESEPCICAHKATSAATSASARGTPQARPAAHDRRRRPVGVLRLKLKFPASILPSRRRCAGKESLGVAVEYFLVNLLDIAERTPILDQPLMRQGRPVPAEQDAVLQPAADFLL